MFLTISLQELSTFCDFVVVVGVSNVVVFVNFVLAGVFVNVLVDGVFVEVVVLFFNTSTTTLELT